jgi:hypothetical protein
MSDSFEAHEDWIEWRFLQEAKKSLEEEIRGLAPATWKSS